MFPATPACCVSVRMPRGRENSGGDPFCSFARSVTVNEIAVIRSDTKRRREKERAENKLGRLGHCHAFNEFMARRYLIDMEGWLEYDMFLQGLV